jgi:hypothetical protein
LRRAGAGHLCPVCIRPVATGACREHGRWRRHQLLTRGDRHDSERGAWQPFTPLAQACPRCLGEVTEVRSGFVCVDHGHDHDRHGPFRVDELLGPTAQRESALSRNRLVRRTKARRRQPVRLSLNLPDPARSARLAFSATIVAATLAFLTR